jgi:hypothetical protein
LKFGRVTFAADKSILNMVYEIRTVPKLAEMCTDHLQDDGFAELIDDFTSSLWRPSLNTGTYE